MGILKLPHEVKEYFKIEFENVMKRSKMDYIYIIDYDIGNRLISVKLTATDKCRYYFRYGALIQYCYDNENEDEACLIGMLCYKTNKDGILEECSHYVKYWHTDLSNAIPNFMIRYFPGRKYRIILGYTKPPFIDEDMEIIRQDYSVNDSYTNIPIFPRPGYYLMEFEGYRLLVQHSGCLTVVKRGEVDYSKMPITQANIGNVVYSAVIIDHYWNRQGEFWPLTKFDFMKNIDLRPRDLTIKKSAEDRSKNTYLLINKNKNNKKNNIKIINGKTE